MTRETVSHDLTVALCHHLPCFFCAFQNNSVLQEHVRSCGLHCFPSCNTVGWVAARAFPSRQKSNVLNLLLICFGHCAAHCKAQVKHGKPAGWQRRFSHGQSAGRSPPRTMAASLCTWGTLYLCMLLSSPRSEGTESQRGVKVDAWRDFGDASRNASTLVLSQKRCRWKKVSSKHLLPILVSLPRQPSGQGGLCSHPVACFLPEWGQPPSTHWWSLSFLSLGFSSKEELNPKPLESISQGNPSMYFRINFIIKRYHFINYTLLECIQIK